VCIGEHTLDLNTPEYEVLYLLVANEGRVLTRDEIVDHLWGVDFVSGSNVVDRHVRTLRVKLQDNWRAPRYLATVPGRGYRFGPASADERDTASGYARAVAAS
jgi:two-component system alkaline phosphatase synthesis response regulator PhoP